MQYHAHRTNQIQKKDWQKRDDRHFYAQQHVRRTNLMLFLSHMVFLCLARMFSLKN